MTYFTIDEVAKLLKIHRNTVIKFIESGKLKVFKIGKQYRVSQDQINDFLKLGKV
jgi:putative molybdopterin biosynthesis protein